MKYLTKKWYADSQGNFEKVKEGLNSYWKHQEELLHELPDDFIFARIGLHDCIIESEEFSGNNFILRMDGKREKSDVTQLIFINARFVGENECLAASSWLYHEIYIVDEAFEVHILADKNGILHERAIVADNVEVVQTRR